jgi:hypothetical protein
MTVQALADRFGTHYDDRHGRGRALRSARSRGAGSQQHINFLREQFGYESRHLRCIAVGVALFAHKVATENVSTVYQTPAQSCEEVKLIPRSAHPDATDFLRVSRLLRERDPRQCCHGGSETGDKLASLHANAPQPDDRTLPLELRCASQQI